MGVRGLLTVAGATVAGLALVVAAAGPAGAKGPIELTITFPGGGPPLQLMGGEVEGTPAVGQLTEDLGLWSTFGDSEVSPLMAEPPAMPVSKPYIITWTMYDGGGEPIVITQQLYMDPPGGGLVHTEAGQYAGPYSRTEETLGGWFQAPESLSATFLAAGFKWTAPPPDAAPGTAAETARPTQGDTTVVTESGTADGTTGPSLAKRVGVAVLAVGAGTAAAGLAVRRARRGRDAAPAAG